MKHTLILLIGLLIAAHAISAQTRYYCYDAAGNRVAKSSSSNYCSSNSWGKGEPTVPVSLDANHH